MHETESPPLAPSNAGLSVADTAELLGVSPTTVRAHLRQGTFAGEKVGGTWVVYLAGLPQQLVPATPNQPESMPAPGQPTPSSSRPVTILAWLVVLLRRLSRRVHELRALVSRA